MPCRGELRHKKALCLQFFKSICTKLCTKYFLVMREIKKSIKKICLTSTETYTII